MTAPVCICDFPEVCDGSGHVPCLGCGGESCVCAACMGNGEDTCDGCAACEPRSIEDDDYDSDYEDQS